MTSGKADPQKLYFGGKLKITGNVMASQKLGFLAKLGGGAEAAPAAKEAPVAAASPSSTGSARAPALFRALGERWASTPELAREVGATLQFILTEPSGAWVVEARDTPAVREGKAERADVTLRLSDETLMELAQDPRAASRLYQQGKLRVDGDVRLASRLGFLAQLG